MLTRTDESDLIDDIKDGIGIALERRGASAKSIDSIKLNKLVYLAVMRLDIPITFGWYKYGPAPVDLHYSESAVTAKSKEECDAPHGSRLPERDYYSPVEYSYFFGDELTEFETILQAPTKEFLISFYEREAPEQYRELYMRNARLQQIIDEIKTDDTWHESADSYYREISRRVGELARELMQIESLREVQNPFRQYARFLKTLFANASTLNSLSASQQQLIKRVIQYYYGGAWKYVALKISENTVHLSPGHNQEKLITSIENERQELRSEYEADLERFTQRAIVLQIIEQEQENSGDASTEQVDVKYKHSELWTKASAEAWSNDYNKGVRNVDK